ncbi:hypothetical protein SUGI_0719850 [Cryptomeria japonica]|nr:hypothetical protein SUGI_0719850 [Cryptomeria japonica]
MELIKADEVVIDQDLWVIQMKEGLQMYDEQEEEKEIFVSVFGVPKELLIVKPEAYIPQCVSIGPYHHWRSQLFKMERYKVAAALGFEKTLTGDQQVRICGGRSEEVRLANQELLEQIS